MTTEQQETINQIYVDYYTDCDWVYRHSSAFTVKKRWYFMYSVIDARINVADGKMIDQSYTQFVLQNIFSKIDLQNYFVGISISEILDLPA